jgi:hypothetical protein
MEPLVSIDEEYYAIDGKRIRQPIAGADGKTRFVGLVSVFAHQQGITVDLASLSETENSPYTDAKHIRFIQNPYRISPRSRA